ncbi:4-(cytidine 5'-diphospho)-2-C-methyl-D-erythritol kinase [Prevotella sp. DNF00663]|uniref:4-(cytidine 5'-diphospho)-2-C-methyl-D-erythritol kinase n=1 Tax=Prevotella sp. DNF00663 TaxID=1384078 RepID=UPI0007849D46|nr:4-(cytidine 5'-diphospho)-2-C-methyl-D-erythritol kinase [Prevotella sp. DNF00663]KXB83176.1 4-(cytidine 5'-diphospho)-2-C-methyl-D-erythritol kinase [Prevotella sp. DNF00663]
MISFPCAKINLGLNIIGERSNGYHDLETVFYPIYSLHDTLEIKYMGEDFPSDTDCDLKITGNVIECNEQDNLVVKAYNLLASDFELPRVHAHLYKKIPSQAGLGGGSSDAAYMIKLLDERFRLNIGYAEMERYAAKLGADCAFFITSELSYATGLGDIISPVDGPKGNLNGYYIVIIKPDISISTKEAYQSIVPQKPLKCCKDIIRQPIETWKEALHNDFEIPIFKAHEELAAIKQTLYDLGAIYAQMSGSGSAIFGIFRIVPNGLEEQFPNTFIFSSKL